MQESIRYLDKRDNSVVTLILRGNGFVRVKPKVGLEIVLSIKSFKENFEKIKI